MLQAGVRFRQQLAHTLHVSAPGGFHKKFHTLVLRHHVARTAGKDSVRTYRLASMLDVKTGSRTFKRPRGFNLARTWQASAARFESELRKLQARVRVSPRGLKWLSNARVQVAASPAEAAKQIARPDWCEV